MVNTRLRNVQSRNYNSVSVVVDVDGRVEQKDKE